MITRIVSIAFVLVFGFTARSQVSSTELSYFPHSIGDTWTYKVSVANGVSGPVFSHYNTITVNRVTGNTSIATQWISLCFPLRA